jgi:hypothetical protein
MLWLPRIPKYLKRIMSCHTTQPTIMNKKLILEKVNTKNKRSSERWKSSIDFDGVEP